MQVVVNVTMRIMASAASEAQVAEVMAALQSGVARFAGVERWSSERYWKIPDWFDISIQLTPLGDPKAVYEALVALMPVWWHSDDDGEYGQREALWNREVDPQGCFLHPAINWVQLFLEYQPVMPEQPKFAAGDRVRLKATETGELAPEMVALVGAVTTIEYCWPTFEGRYQYGLFFGQNGEQMSLHWEEELEAASPDES